MRGTDDYLYGHALATSVWALSFGRHLGLDKETLTLLGTGAMLLDIGKIRIPPKVLRKPGALDPPEWKLMQMHAAYGARLLRAAPGIDPRILSMVESHHERQDGSGYPSGLKGDQIPLIARIAGIVDSYDAMITNRSHARAKSAYDAVRELTVLSGKGFQAELVELFVQAVGVFPTGTLVELNTGEVGVVIAQNRFRRLRPEVMVILDGAKQVRSEFVTVDLLTCEANHDAQQPGLWITQALEPGAHGLDPEEYFL
jgi:HD-GYP domain-containing protein (c-di-GMP phosphodiesterase class II)